MNAGPELALHAVGFWNHFMEPRIHQFPGGWAVTGDGFAAYAGTKDEALQRYQLHQARHCRVPECERIPVIVLEGVSLCASHYDNFLSRGGASGTTDRDPARRTFEDVRGSDASDLANRS